MHYTRRDVLSLGMAAAAATLRPPTARAQQPLITKPIPASGERLPVVGLGARNYRLGPGWADDTLGYRETLQTFHMLGGRLVDTSPNYGDSESIVGELIDGLGVRDRLFIATKVDRDEANTGIIRMENSLRRMRTARFELMQVHNLDGWQVMLPIMREWKQEGRLRYIGITTSSDRQYDEMVAITRAEDLDFIQVDYAIDERAAADRILPLAAERGAAVLVNMPFGRGRLFQRVAGLELPGWAADLGCTSWAQMFLKYVVSHPAVTAAIPGTTKPHHAVDNVGAARGDLPDESLRRRMEQLIDELPA